MSKEVFGSNNYNYQFYPYSHLDRSNNKINQIKQVLPGDFRANSVLDLGCNIGVVTKAISEQVKAKTVHGVDLSQEFIPITNYNLSNFDNSSVFRQDIDNFNALNVYDLTMAIDVIEHLPNPSKTLKKISEMSNYVLLRSPIEDSAINRFNLNYFGVDYCKLMEKKYGHINHFTSKSLYDLISRGGLNIINEANFRINPKAQMLENSYNRGYEKIVWNVSPNKYPELCGGSKILFCSSSINRIIDSDTYNKIYTAIENEFDKDNIVSVILFGSTTGKNVKLSSDYDFCVILKELSEDINVREAASPRMKKRLREMGVTNLCAFNLYTKDEFFKTNENNSWLIETIKNGYRILYDRDVFAESVLSTKKENIKKVDLFSWKGIEVEDPKTFVYCANRHYECAKLLNDLDPKLAAYHQMEGDRGIMISKLYKHGVYNTRSSVLTLANKLNHNFKEEYNLTEIQKNNFLLETDWKKAIYNYDSIENNLKAANILEKNGYHQEALFHNYNALKNIYLKLMHQRDIFVFDGEISQIFLREFGQEIPKILSDSLHSCSFKAEQLLGRSGYSSFDLNSQGKPLYLNSTVDNKIVTGVSGSIRDLIPEFLKHETIISNNEQINKEPLISIVIATYNRPKYLLDCIISLNNLIIPKNKIEILVVDDGSNVNYDFDDIKKISIYPIKIINKEHSGICATKNRGIDESRGKYIAFLDDDMVVSPFWLTNLMSGFRDDTIAGVGSTNLTYPSQNKLSQYSDYRELIRAPFIDKTGQILNVITCSAVIRKDILNQVDGFNKRQSDLGVNFGGDDVDLTWKIRNEGFVFNYVKDAISFHNHRNSFRGLVKQHIGYGEGTMFHCLDKNRNPSELGIPKPTILAVSNDLIRYITKEVPLRFINCYRDNLGIKKSTQYPILDFCRRLSYDIGILKARKYKQYYEQK